MSSDIQRSASPHRTHSVPFPIGTTYIELTNAINIETTSNPKAIQVRHPKEAIANTVTDLGLDYLPYIVRTNKPGTTLDTTITGQQDQSDPNTSPDPNSQPYPIKVELMSKQESLYAWVANIKDKIEEYNKNLPDIIANILESYTQLDDSTRVAAIGLALKSYLPEDQRATFIGDVLNDKYLGLDLLCKRAAIEQIQYLPEDQRARFMEDILNDRYPNLDNLKERAIKQILYLNQDEMAIFIKAILNNKYPSLDLNCKKIAMSIVNLLSQQDIYSIIDEILGNKYSDFLHIDDTIERYITTISQDQKTIIIEDILKGEKYPNLGTHPKQMAVDQIQNLSKDQRSKLYELALDKDLITQKYFNARINELKAKVTIPTTSPLHEIAQQDRIVKLDKTGSETFILPIPNVEEIEASVRIINYPSFLAWLKAATAIDTWQEELGFDYIPIEPILDFNSSNNTIKVAITTANLRGASLYKSIHLYDSRIQQQIQGNKALLIDILKYKLSIIHGHIHDNNFVLVPQLDSDNQPDPSKMPRIYVIDFDMAMEM
jgi:hypothetical protein